MSFNQLPNWGNNTFGSSKQSLYISTTAIGLSNGNKVALPTEYSTISFSTLKIGNLVVNENSFSGDVADWANFSAVDNVNMSYHDLCNVGAARFKGNITLDGTGNLISPYWYDVKLDGNIKTATAQTQYAPTCEQYFGGTDIYNNSFDPASILNNATFNNAHMNLSKGAYFLPIGSATMESKNYNLSIPFVNGPISYLAGTYRGSAYFGVNGSGPSAYIRMNYDTLGNNIPGNSALVEINADSVAGISELASSRVRTTAGKCDMLGTYGATMTAGTKIISIDPNYNTNYKAVCAFELYSYDGIFGIPDPVRFEAGSARLSVTGSNGLTGDTYGNAIIDIAARRASRNTLGYSANLNLTGEDNVYVNGYHLFLRNNEIRFGEGYDVDFLSQGVLQFRSQVNLYNLENAVGAYPTKLSNTFTDIYNKLSNVSTSSDYMVSNWASFPAVSNVDLAYNSLNQVKQINLWNPTDQNDITFLLTPENSRHLSYTDGINSAIPVAGDWSYYHAVSNVDVNFQDVVNVNSIQLDTINSLPGYEHITINTPVIYNSNINMNSNIISNVGSIYFNDFTSLVHENIDGVNYLVTQVPYKVWNFMIILDTGGNNPGFKLEKQTVVDEATTYATATVTFDGYYVNIDKALFLQGNPLLGANYIDIMNPATGNSITLSYVTQTYNNGDSYDELAYGDTPFLYKNPNNKIELISVEDIQMIDTINGNYNYLVSQNDELVFQSFDPNHNLIKEIGVASYWSSYPANATVNLSNNDLKGVKKFEIADVRQPFIQFGRVNSGDSGIVTVTLPRAYIDSNYAVQISRVGSSTYSRTYYVDDITTVSFRVNSDVANMEFSWTTFGLDT